MTIAKKRAKQKKTKEARTPEETAAMLKKAELIHNKLKELYPVAPASFLEPRDPFQLLCATVLSAQCLDTTVNSVTPALFAAAGTPAEMRDLGAARIRPLISRVSFSGSKSKYLAGLSAQICTEHDGVVPDTAEELERLPGVGHKTASAVLIHAFGKPAFPVDTHVHRLACRWGIGDANSVVRTEENLKEWFPAPADWGPLDARMVRFGREYCPARGHDMDACPVCSFAATEEARAANRASPGKFVAAVKHKDPYMLWSADAKGGAADRATDVGSSSDGSLAGMEVIEPVVASTAKGTSAGKKGRVAKAAVTTGKQAGRRKRDKAKAVKGAEPNGIRKSARIASQKQ